MGISYSIHISFEDGSTPYAKYNMDRSDYTKEIRKWRKNYTLTLNRVEEMEWRDRIVFITASKKQENMGKGKNGYYYRRGQYMGKMQFPKPLRFNQEGKR